MRLSENKFLYLLDSFSAEELQEFKKFVASPYIASGRNYLPLLNELIRLRNRKQREVTLEELHNKLYPGKKFSAQTLKNRFSELFKIGESFLIFKSINSNGDIVRDRLLLRALRERKLGKFFESNYRKATADLEKIPLSEKKFEDHIDLQRINLEHLVQNRKFEKYFSEYYENSLYQTCLSFINLFEFGMEFKQQDYLNKKYDFNIVSEILKKIDFGELARRSEYRMSYVFKFTLLFYHLYKCFEDLENESDYFEARKIFKEIKDHISEDTRLKIYMMFIYYCTHKQNQGVKKFVNELFALYNEKLKSGYTSDFRANSYPLNNFRDYVLIGLELKEFEWVENFLKEYSDFLPEETRFEEVAISKAKVRVAHSDFGEALKELAGTKPSNFIHYLDISTIRLVCYFELEMIEEAYAEMDKFRHYLRNHKEVPKIHKMYATNFLKFYSLLLKARADLAEIDYEMLDKELRSTPYVNRASWLRKKLREYSK